MSIPVTLFLSGPGGQGLKLLRETRARMLNKEDRMHLFCEEGGACDETSALAGLQVSTWSMSGGILKLSSEANGEDWNVLLYSHAQPPMDWLQSIVGSVRKFKWEVTRIITLVDMQMAIHRPEARRWYQACIHFSDLVLLGNRGGLNPKDVAGFQEHFEKERFPCLFDLVKNGLPRHLSWMMDSQPRRLSLVFDPDELTGHDIPAWEDDDREENEEDDRYKDPYLEKNRSGEPVLRIPNHPYDE